MQKEYGNGEREVAQLASCEEASSCDETMGERQRMAARSMQQ